MKQSRLCGNLSGARVTVMGLGLHGGGVAATRFLVSQGAEVTVTDLRDEGRLASSLEDIAGLPVRLVLGRHEDGDFTGADFVLKNPAVPRHSPYLEKAKRIETDLSLFLRRFSGPVLAVTGTKGKSTTAGALHYGLTRGGVPAKLGGNITISPLTFLGEEPGDYPVVLELSSFQLGDLTMVDGGIGVLVPRIGVITSFFRDHQDYYGSMERYFADKAILAAAVPPEGSVVLGATGEYGRRFSLASRAPVYWADAGPGWGAPARAPGVALTDHGVSLVVPSRGADPLEIPLPEGTPRAGPLRLNYGMTLLSLFLYGVEPEILPRCLEGFTGVEHRLEYCGTVGGCPVYNDSAATVPEATLAAVRSFSVPVRLIAGGTDKILDYGALAEAAAEAAGTYFLEGSATEKMLAAVSGSGGSAFIGGPFGSLGECLDAALGDAAAGEVIVFSPGCASFEKFDNE
ncbi:MAG: UDP-N-acetylmuramoyl-L-alanine--D-glutamate ligase, partial [Spirochaetota bacterium]